MKTNHILGIVIFLLSVALVTCFLCKTREHSSPAMIQTSIERCSMEGASFDGEKEACVYKDEEGKIFAKFVMPTDENANPSYPHAVIRAENNNGQSTSVTTAFGIDSITKDIYNGQVVLKAANRENERMIGQDELLYIALQGTPPQIKKVLSEPGFAEHPYTAAEWYFIPFKDREPYQPENFMLKKIDLEGNELSSWDFGKTLVRKPDWKNSHIMTTQLIGEYEVLVSFSGGPGCPEEKFSVCQRYILDVQNQTVKSIE